METKHFITTDWYICLECGEDRILEEEQIINIFEPCEWCKDELAESNELDHMLIYGE